MATVVKLSPTPYDSVIAKANSLLNGLSPTGLRTTAAQQATAQLSPQVAAENAANATAQRLYGEQYTRETEFAKAMAALRQPDAGMASAPYADVAGSLGGLAGGVNDAATGAMSAAHDEASQAGAAYGGVGQVNQTYDPGLAAQVWKETGVTLPTQDLSARAAAAAAGARNSADVAADQIGVIANNLNQQAQDALAQHNQTLAQIRAQRPSIFQQALDSLQARRAQAMDTLASLTGNRANYLQNASQIAETHRANLANEANARANTAVTAGYLGQAVKTGDVSRRTAIAQMTGIDPVTNQPIAGYFRDAKGNVIPYSAYVTAMYNNARINYYKQIGDARALTAKAAMMNAGTARKKLTAQAAQKTASAQANVFKGATKVAQTLVKQLYGTGLSGGVQTPTDPNSIQSQTAYQQAYGAIASYLRGAGLADATTIDATTRRVLDAAGFVTPTNPNANSTTWGLPATQTPSGATATTGSGSRGAF